MILSVRVYEKRAFLAYLLLLSGCYAAGLNGGGKTVAETASAYYKMLMWRYYDRASVFVDEEKRKGFEELFAEDRSNLNITSYEIKEVIMEGDERSLVKVLVTYYKYPSVSEKTVVVEDTWVRKKGSWYIRSDFEDEMFR